MNLNKDQLNGIIENFKTNKETLRVSDRLLSKFDKNNKEHKECLSYVRGTGGYYIPFLKYLVEKTKPETIVELGNQTGMSTLALYDGMKQIGTGNFYTIDIEKDQRFCPDEMFNDNKVHFLFGDVCSKAIIDQLPRNIDLLFTDTLHYDYQLRDEFEIYQHLLADTALVAIDDIRSNDKGKLFDELPFSKWDLTELCHGSGWGLFLFERKAPRGEREQERNLTAAIFSVWEKKYNRLNKELQKKNNTVWKRCKNQLKKIHPLYALYTRIFNKLHHMFFKKTVHFYER